MARLVHSDGNTSTFMLPSHFVASESEAIVNGIPPDQANDIYHNGGFVLFPSLPTKGLTVGIDYRNFTPTEKFMGFKMIPPGLHYFTVKFKEAPTISFFLWIELGSVYAPKWNQQAEDFEDSLYSEFWPKDASAEQMTRAKEMLKSYDDRLAVYPFTQLKEWTQLTSHISFQAFERLRPANQLGKISEQLEFETKEQVEESGQGSSEGFSKVNKDNPVRIRFKDDEGMPVFHYKPGGKIFFTDIPQNIAGQSTTKTRLARMLQTINYKELLAEVQYSFVIFLVGQSYVGLDRWKRLLQLLSESGRGIAGESALFEEFVVLFYFQMKTISEDFFEDLFTGDNFLKAVIPLLFANVEDSDYASPVLKKRSKQLQLFCEKKFQRSFELV